MSNQSHDPPENFDRVRYLEPVTIRLYGFKEISLPTYLMWLLITILVVVVLIAGCYEIMHPQTAIGERIRRSQARERWVLDTIAWGPTFLWAGIIFEVFEAAFVIFAFRRRFKQLRDED
ncbi:MAG: hypothetical protein O3B13_09100 [Planctomycetota bacterium]|nr:hypothetical protein [Planctomycetota bacterium]